MRRGRRFLLWGFRTAGEAGRALGSLEQRLMEIVWASREVTVREALDALDTDIAYTTVMTTLDRLFKKGLLERRKEGRAFAYAAAVSRDELQRALAAGFFDRLLQARPHPLPALSTLVDAVGDHDRDLLDELERLVREKRRALDEREPS
ncbi:MAG TPA: BlaI/MecI/CopY family transcriptional regulator [Vicinamibacterales bacterium]|jgi:predicted transcriptional regulator